MPGGGGGVLSHTVYVLFDSCLFLTWKDEKAVDRKRGLDIAQKNADTTGSPQRTSLNSMILQNRRAWMSEKCPRTGIKVNTVRHSSRIFIFIYPWSR